MNFKVIPHDEAANVVGGIISFDSNKQSDYIYKCWDTAGTLYWDTKPNKAGCVNSNTGKTEKGSTAQRKG
ncbi:hypothetical protein [Pandoraea sp. NPDC090278]|uniref:hypothetical protein n=1 Tax=Pandoraea sp. NPDC090278 TaxID=3364391 RepID=UPI00383BAD7E